MSEENNSALKPMLLTRNELRLIIHWKKNCEDETCPLYSIEGGAYFCNLLIDKLVSAFNDWKEEEEIADA